MHKLQSILQSYKTQRQDYCLEDYQNQRAQYKGDDMNQQWKHSHQNIAQSIKRVSMRYQFLIKQRIYSKFSKEINRQDKTQKSTQSNQFGYFIVDIYIFCLRLNIFIKPHQSSIKINRQNKLFKEQKTQKTEPSRPNNITQIIFNAIIMISQQQLDKCFDELKTKRKLQDITTIINNYKPILPPVLQSISLAFQTSPPPPTNYSAFVPSPDLLKTYQSTFEKANQNERIVNTTNYKLKASFGQSVPKKNRVQASTVSVAIAEQPIIVDQMENNIFQQLAKKQVTATIPNMEQTLFKHELSNLQKKEVVVEHTLPLSEWKKIRAKLSLQQK